MQIMIIIYFFTISITLPEKKITADFDAQLTNSVLVINIHLSYNLQKNFFLLRYLYVKLLVNSIFKKCMKISNFF